MTKVFLVDDDPLLVRLYEKAFKSSDYEVETAFNGEDALKKLPTIDPKPTVILLDVMMPKVNGLQVLEEIKKDAALKDIPVVMLTNLAREENIEKALSLGAVTYLIKSKYQPKEIVLKVKEIVAGYAGGVVPEVKTLIKDAHPKNKKKEK